MSNLTDKEIEYYFTCRFFRTDAVTEQMIEYMRPSEAFQERLADFKAGVYLALGKGEETTSTTGAE